jgi:hypothetical protein
VPDIGILNDLAQPEAMGCGSIGGGTKLGLRLSFSDVPLIRLDGNEPFNDQAIQAKNIAAASLCDVLAMDQMEPPRASRTA